MARILICEPHPEVRELLQHVVVRLGHEPVFEDGTPNGSLGDIDLILLEPAYPAGIAAARITRVRNAGVPVVCASIAPPNGHVTVLEPVAFLMKPFALPALEEALENALSRRAAA